MPHVPYNAATVLAALNQSDRPRVGATIDYTDEGLHGATLHLRPLREREWGYYKGLAARQPESLYPLVLLVARLAWEAMTAPNANGTMERDLMERQPYEGFAALDAVPQDVVELLGFDRIMAMAMLVIDASMPADTELAAASFSEPSTHEPPESPGATGAADGAADAPTAGAAGLSLSQVQALQESPQTC